MRKLLLLTGDIAAGKSAFSRQLSERYGVPAFQKDSIKEILGDSIGFRNREENVKLSRATMELMYHFFRQFAVSAGNLILEANFHGYELQEMHRIAGETQYDVLTLVLRGDADVLYERYLHRMNCEHRHPVHLSTTIDRKDDFMRCAELLREETVMGNVIEVDASSFFYQTDPALLRKIDLFMSGSR